MSRNRLEYKELTSNSLSQLAKEMNELAKEDWVACGNPQVVTEYYHSLFYTHTEVHYVQLMQRSSSEFDRLMKDCFT